MHSQSNFGTLVQRPDWPKIKTGSSRPMHTIRHNWPSVLSQGLMNYCVQKNFWFASISGKRTSRKSMINNSLG